MRGKTNLTLTCVCCTCLFLRWFPFTSFVYFVISSCFCKIPIASLTNCLFHLQCTQFINVILSTVPSMLIRTPSWLNINEVSTCVRCLLVKPALKWTLSVVRRALCGSLVMLVMEAVVMNMTGAFSQRTKQLQHIKLMMGQFNCAIEQALTVGAIIHAQSVTIKWKNIINFLSCSLIQHPTTLQFKGLISATLSVVITEFVINALYVLFLQRNKIIKHEVKKLQKEAAKKWTVFTK